MHRMNPQLRSKDGVLEFKKSDGLKKTWKPYTFKVSASTFLLRFKAADVSTCIYTGIGSIVLPTFVYQYIYISVF